MNLKRNRITPVSQYICTDLTTYISLQSVSCTY